MDILLACATRLYAPNLKIEREEMTQLLQSLSDYLYVSNLLNSIFCLFIVLFIRVVLETKNDSASRRSFKKFVTIVLVCLVADMCSYIFDAHTYPGAYVLNHISMFASVLLTVFVGYRFNHLFDRLFHIKRTPKQERIHTLIYCLPTAITLVLLIANLFTGFLYYVDDNNVYHRGTWYFISCFLQYVSFSHAIVRARLEKHNMINAPMKREKMRKTVLCFGAVVLFFGFLQVLMGGKIALHCFGLTAGVFVMFVRFLDDQITQDRLTNLNNRYALEAYIQDKTRSYEGRANNPNRLYLILLDVNDFKMINDRFGHLEGDNALRCIADALREMSLGSRKKLFVSRFGGDEFAAVLEARDEESVARFAERLKQILEDRTIGWSYRIDICMGYAAYRGPGTGMLNWIAEADVELYENKRARASERSEQLTIE